MSTSTLLTRGFGSFGSVPFVITGGLGLYGVPGLWNVGCPSISVLTPVRAVSNLAPDREVSIMTPIRTVREL